MRFARLYVLPLVGVAACTFPDVTYSDADGGTCPQLAGCESIAEGCNGTAMYMHMNCWHACNGQSKCQMDCNYTLSSARTACAMDCETCAPAACGDTTTACQTAAGVGAPYY
jgi:hypothetical protein